ncbi:Molybdate-binding periplasmic protein precursor [Roseimaritima multifibrata]|uniref:Molybdate-binding periplasmic protein n=1 Tax=Roseimaritima multifibrata TaxID=1930274 RepID=A0A517MMV5_9BACT|nr:molybdate ABC transporter substrate-binding protein [Roseimaritima multifibrata]QDS96225.1 Molybdate-binding periplasmic protein precursor [Roseimaritima multifibrata]
METSLLPILSPSTHSAAWGAILPLVFSLLGCGSNSAPIAHRASPETSTLTIAAASNLRFALEELNARFCEANPDCRLQMHYGSSGHLFAQLIQQAPFDLFLSADTRYPQQLVQRGAAAPADYFEYAEGTLIAWVPSTSELSLQTAGLTALKSPKVVRLGIANPRLAPYGTAAQQSLQNAGLWEDLMPRIVYGENITQVAHFIETGTVDAAILAGSLTRSGRRNHRGQEWAIPTDQYDPIRQAGVITKHSEQPLLAARFRDWLLSAEGQAVLQQQGYASPKVKP